MNIPATVFGLMQGIIFIPLSLYMALLVRNDLHTRLPALYRPIAAIAALLTMILWLAMSYSLADMLLDSISDSGQARLEAGRMWVKASFAGLITLAIASILISKFRKD